MKNIIMQPLVKRLVFAFILLLSFLDIKSQNNRIDLSNNSYESAYFKEVLPADAIKAIKFPEFDTLKNALNDTLLNYLNDNDWVLVFKYKNAIKLYPIMPLIWHEVVNDQIEDLHIAVTYCVLTGSAMVYNRKLQSGNIKTFGVSGCLYNSNLVMYDYQNRSTWSQLVPTCASGIDKNIKLQMLSFEWAKFSYIKEHYSDNKILVGDKYMMNFVNMYKRFPFNGLDKYADHDSLRHPAKIITDEHYSNKDVFLLFPETNKAISLKNINKKGHRLIDITYEKDQIKCLKPKNDNIFIPVYFFALKAFYPEVRILN